VSARGKKRAAKVEPLNEEEAIESNGQRAPKEEMFPYEVVALVTASVLVARSPKLLEVINKLVVLPEVQKPNISLGELFSLPSVRENKETLIEVVKENIPIAATIAAAAPTLHRILKDRDADNAVFVSYLIVRSLRASGKSVKEGELNKKIWREVWELVHNNGAVAKKRLELIGNGKYNKWARAVEKKAEKRFNRLTKTSKRIETKTTQIKAKLEAWLPGT
jgi:hypothetical protein